MSELGEFYDAMAVALRGPGGSDEALRVVCRSAVQVLAVDGTAISTMHDTRHRETVCASDQVADGLEELQFALGEGPCFEAFEYGVPVLVPDLGATGTGRWPVYAARAAEQSAARSVFVFPLAVGSLRLGTLSTYRGTTGSLDAATLGVGVELAETAALVLMGAQDPDGEVAREQRAAVTRERRVGPGGHEKVHVAAGMLAERLGLDPDAAFDRLRAHAFAQGRLLADVAADVLARRLRLD